VQLIEFHDDIQGVRNWAHELELRGMKSLINVQTAILEAYPEDIRWLADHVVQQGCGADHRCAAGSRHRPEASDVSAQYAELLRQGMRADRGMADATEFCRANREVRDEGTHACLAFRRLVE
jgi:hypothetical protein